MTLSQQIAPQVYSHLSGYDSLYVLAVYVWVSRQGLTAAQATFELHALPASASWDDRHVYSVRPECGFDLYFFND